MRLFLASLFLRVGIFYLRTGLALLGRERVKIQAPLFFTTVHTDMTYRPSHGLYLEPWITVKRA